MNGQVDPIWVKLDRLLDNNALADHFPCLIQNSFRPCAFKFGNGQSQVLYTSIKVSTGMVYDG